MTNTDHIDDLEESDDQPHTDRPVVKHVVKDLNTAVKMKKVMAQAEAEARKAEAQTELARVKAEERRRKQELDAEVAKIRLGMSAGEKARWRDPSTSSSSCPGSSACWRRGVSPRTK